MNAPQLAKIDHPASWTARSLTEQSAKWAYQLSPEDVAELDQGLQQVKSLGLVVPNFGTKEFPMPKLAAKLASFKEGLCTGIGLLYIKGLPISRYTKDQASAIFWGIGSHIGIPWPQNVRGHLLGDIRDEGRTLDDPMARGYQTTADLDMHTDGADIVALLCLKQAPQGGENQLCSALSAFNKLVDTDPAAAQHLLDTPWCIDWRGEEPPGKPPYHKAPLLTRVGDVITCFDLIPYVHSAQRFEEVPRLTERDRSALAAFEKAIWDDELVVRLRQEPGDMVFINNHYHVHARSTFKDLEDPAEKRHLRRLWLETDAWAAQRPVAMSTFLHAARSFWEKPGSSVQMWDHM